MAVVNVVDGLTAEILINGDPATEYPDPDPIQVTHEDNAIRAYQIKRTASNYIGAESGQNFSIRMRVSQPLGHRSMAHAKLTMDVEVDGISVWPLVCDRPFFKKHPDGAVWEGVVSGPKDGKGRACTVREFSFLKIQTNSDITESKTIKRQEAHMKQKGTIVITVHNASAGRAGGPTIVVPKKGAFLKKDEANVSEKAVKGTAKSHAAMLGKAKKTVRGPVFRTEKKDGEDYFVAKFIFNYRDYDSLKQMHVIPRDPSPIPSLSSRSESPSASSSRQASATPEMPQMSQKEVFEKFKTWLKSQEGSLELNTTKGRRAAKVKKERGEKRGLSDAVESPIKKLKVDKDGVVDLTSDNEANEEEAVARGVAESERDRANTEASDDEDELFVQQRRR
ncbi:hypothetical protein IFR05_004616 [Cadophora sp. M221]|nr:hypothetical protein IFR05_004616 [Cadophora sp. M221]